MLISWPVAANDEGRGNSRPSPVLPFRFGLEAARDVREDRPTAIVVGTVREEVSNPREPRPIVADPRRLGVEDVVHAERELTDVPPQELHGRAVLPIALGFQV